MCENGQIGETPEDYLGAHGAVQAANTSSLRPSGSPEIKQSIYDHGGSRIWREPDGRRDLLVDTYHTREFAEAVRDFTDKWFRENVTGEASLPAEENV